MIDKTRVQQILINLIQNAIKFSQPQMTITVTVNSKTIAKTAQDYSELVVSVVD